MGTYMKYGAAGGCSSTGRGGTWRMNVYRIVSKSKSGTEKKPATACVPTLGPKAGHACVFPYKYGGKTCAGPNCCNFDKDSRGSWCSTKVDRNGRHVRGHYAYCKGSPCDAAPPVPPTPSP